MVVKSSFPAPRVAGFVAGDIHDGGDKRVIPNAPVVGPGDGAKLDPSVIDFQSFVELSAVQEQAVLQVDGRQRRRELP